MKKSEFCQIFSQNFFDKNKYFVKYLPRFVDENFWQMKIAEIIFCLWKQNRQHLKKITNFGEILV